MQRKTLKMAPCLVILVMGLAACATAADTVALGTNTDSRGNVTLGEKFGARVGQSTTEAENALLAQGYGFEGVEACDATTQALLACQQSDHYLAFQPVQNGKRGHIYLRIENGRVAQIGWQINTVAYLDG